MPARSSLLLLTLFLLLCSWRPTFAKIALISPYDEWRFHAAPTEPSFHSLSWTALDFDDSLWSHGRSGFTSLWSYPEVTSLSGYEFGSRSVYFRRTFAVEDTSQIGALVLRLLCSDGFIAYLNGVEVARFNVPGEPGVSLSHTNFALEPSVWTTKKELDLTAHRSFLRAGTNVLAVHLLRSDSFSTAFVFLPELLANFSRGPFVQNSSARSTQIIWSTIKEGRGMVRYGTNSLLEHQLLSESETNHHALTLTNLRPGTHYFYQVESVLEQSSRLLSPVMEFRTLQETGKVKFLVFGDSGFGSAEQYELARLMREEQTDLVLHVGDVIYPHFSDDFADLRCLSVYRDMMQRVPFYFALGNHDLPEPNLSGRAFTDTFYLPTNNVPSALHRNPSGIAETSPEHFYSFDHGEVHFVALFQPYAHQYLFAPGSVQYEWLTNDLARTTKKWKVLFCHLPCSITGAHGTDDVNGDGLLDHVQFAQALHPIAAKYNVQLLFSGHDHNYERLKPVGGMHHVVSGGGGVFLRGMNFLRRLDPSHAQFCVAHHYTRVTADSDQMVVEPVDLQGRVFDRMVIRATPSPQTNTATWHSPGGHSSFSDGDGNKVGEYFDLIGEPVPVPSGRQSNLGELLVNNDGTNIYLGFRHTMLRPDQHFLLFLGADSWPGVTNASQFGDSQFTQHAEALDLLPNLHFANFKPAVGFILGDEFADRTDPAFHRRGAITNLGQGAYLLNRTLTPLRQVGIRQFNRSPQTSTVYGEEDADYIELTIPLSLFPGNSAPSRIHVAGLVASWHFSTTGTLFRHDSGVLGKMSTLASRLVLEPLEIDLAPDPDPDGDGLTSSLERSIGTDPDKADSDGDELPDGWELENGFNPLRPTGPDSGAGDADQDGFSNYWEFRIGTNPRDPRSVLKLQHTVTAGAVRFQFPLPGNVRFALESSTKPELNNSWRAVWPPGGADFLSPANSSFEAKWLSQTNQYFRLKLFK
jgi:hypothetical protein